VTKNTLVLAACQGTFWDEMTVYAETMPTQMGAITLLTQGDTLVACGFATAAAMHVRLSQPDRLVSRSRRGQIARAVAAYFDGDVNAIDEVPARQEGGSFHQDIWAAMRRVPAGTTVTYTQLATLAGRPHAIRAAGSACAVNLIAVVVPCHRVVRMGGDLGGYAYGLSIKQWLLAHEHAKPPARMRR
jgi:methylated-DNA-[protein]-cysteine S-methyltransferase